MLRLLCALTALAGPAAAQTVVDGKYPEMDRSTVDKALYELTKNLADPVAAQIRNMQLHSHVSVNTGKDVFTLCGEVNQKNTIGAYVGFRPFYVGTSPPYPAEIAEPEDLSGFKAFASMFGCD